VHIPPYSPPQNYEQLIQLGFEPKERKNDVWSKEDTNALMQTIKKINSKQIIPQVIKLNIYFQ